MSSNDPKITEALERLSAAGLTIDLPDGDLPPRGDLPIEHWLLAAANVGATFELDRPASSAPPGAFWASGGTDFLGSLIQKMTQIAPEYFLANVTTDEVADDQKSHVLEFELRGEPYRLEGDCTELEDCHDHLALVFDLANEALADDEAPCAFVVVEHLTAADEKCTYRVLSVDPGRVAELYAVVPYPFGPTENRGAAATVQMTRVRE